MVKFEKRRAMKEENEKKREVPENESYRGREERQRERNRAKEETRERNASTYEASNKYNKRSGRRMDPKSRTLLEPSAILTQIFTYNWNFKLSKNSVLYSEAG